MLNWLKRKINLIDLILRYEIFNFLEMQSRNLDYSDAGSSVGNCADFAVYIHL